VTAAPNSAARRREVATGAGVLWVGTLLFGVSTVILLAALSRHQGKNGFVGLSALLGLAFAGSVLPAGLQLRSAALVADGRGMPKPSRGAMAGLVVAGVVLAPFGDRLLHVPPLAIILVLVQVLLAVRVAILRGALLGVQEFGALGVNLAGEGIARVVLGSALGLLFGITGLAAGMMLATAVAIAVLRTPPGQAQTTIRPTTSLLDTSVALALVGLLVQLDVLLAPSLLSTAAANQYDLAAVPAKGVYSALLAAGPLVFPFVRAQARRRHSAPESAAKWLIAQAASATVGLGVVMAVGLGLVRPLIGVALGKGEPGLGLLLILGLAMSFAGGTAVVANAGVARGVARPWPPVALGMAVLVAVALVGPSATVFGVTAAAVWALVALGSLWVSLYGAAAGPARRSRARFGTALVGRTALLRGRSRTRPRHAPVRSRTREPELWDLARSDVAGEQ
jgi:hypothetical protein